MAKPIIFLAFANQSDNHLDLLKKESSNIKEQLRTLEARDFIKVEREESTTTTDLVNTLIAYPNQISIFHYGGHAESDLLQLEDVDAQAKGVAQLLGEQENLKLVFLNGCSTLEQVQLLFAAGVKAVIATSVKIEDPMAVEFSATFYKALANKRSIKNAFELAKASVELKTDSKGLQIFRGLKLPSQAEEQKVEMPWGLYVQADAEEEILGWRLPYYREIGLPADMMGYIQKSYDINRYIVGVLNEMCKYNKDIYSQMVEMVDGEEVKKDSSTYMDLVIKNFPWVIGSQIQLLRQYNRPDQNRQYQLVSTYHISAMVLYYIVLSNYWDESRRIKSSTSPPPIQQLLPNKQNLLQLNFLSLISQLSLEMEQTEANFFVPELQDFVKDLRSESTPLYKAWQYLEQQKQEIDQLNPDTLEKVCRTTEQALAVILQKMAFLADYRMLTVRNILIDNPRYSPKTYELNLGALNAIVNTSLSLYEDDDKRRKSTYSNSKSIVLVPNEKDMAQSLNLSPFLIDKNTYLDKDHIDLFLFGYQEQEDYFFLAVKHSIFTALKNEKGTDIIDTTMTVKDFQEGHNINKNTFIEDDFGFGDSLGFGETNVVTEESPKVFVLLETQFEQLKTDLP